MSHGTKPWRNRHELAQSHNVRASPSRPGSDGGLASTFPEKYLTPEEVVERYRGRITAGTLRNWRAMRVGPSYLKAGKSILYPAEALEAWDRSNLIACDDVASRDVPDRGGSA